MTPAPSVRVDAFRKTFKVPVRPTGLRAAVRSLWRREFRSVEAVKRVDFEIAPGEVVGFLGPNGAGKTTTLKALSGLLYPTAGRVDVLGYEPFRRQREFLSQITLVMGQRNQLVWDLPVGDSFERNRAIYRLSREEYVQSKGELVELLDLGALLEKPVRNLSLGERMKCEVAAALLHRPKVLFLDEPTLGLDVTMQRRIRKFLELYNERSGATILLTSHYMADVEALCERVVVIHEGEILFDGPLRQLAERFAREKTLQIDLEAARDAEALTRSLDGHATVTEASANRLLVRVPKSETAATTGRILSEFRVADLTVQDPPIEDVIEQVFEARTDLPGETS